MGKIKPGKTNTKVELMCSVCKVFKCNMTVKGVEAKAHPGGKKCKGKTLLECFGLECSKFYGETKTEKVYDNKKPSASAKKEVKPVPKSTCGHKKCEFAPATDCEGFCCKKCQKASLARISPDHGPKCEKKPEVF